MLEYLYSVATDKRNGFLAVLLKVVLFLLSLIYGAIVRALIFVHRLRPVRLNGKVISVGNITLGGTGKTPLVEHIAGYLQRQKHTVAIVTRGYRGGDEAVMLEKRLEGVSVIRDANRLRGSRKAFEERRVTAVIFDDGFQQWGIKKDLEIVLIDARNPFGNRHMLPRGILREPLSSLRRADIFVITKSGAIDKGQLIRELQKINTQALIVDAAHDPSGLYDLAKGAVVGFQEVRGRRVASLCAIADPQLFEGSLKALGMEVCESFRFRDHHQYTQDELENVFSTLREESIDTVITTEKDAAKLCRLQIEGRRVQVLALAIQIKITHHEEEFYNRLRGVYSI